MRSDWDDAPEYLRSRKKQGPWRFLAILGIGSAVIAALALTFGQPIVLDMNQIKQGIRIGGKPLFNPEPAQPIQPVGQPSVENYEALTAVPSPAPQQRLLTQEEIDWFAERSAEAAQSRQTSFNDDNYTPKQPASTYTPPVVREVAAKPASSERRPRTVSRERTSTWIKSWNGGTNYLAEWVAVNNYIDRTSVCGNHRRGSIDYRECRKAAKQHFHEQCQTWRARFDGDRKDLSDRMKTRYCGAASSFNPMG
ncbi:hypothetical protein [Stutzerimonas zhaodongensis]|jgi:hypothetical protein|uniref:Uncharacterized protein n=1 Tax=Stutzerimonas zhaodongensis TaxID=1176257 RepID=A0A365PP11_9GAMM|nr:hypothetical protein [Stutzerimonas zhaodongensis]QWV16809.1 hypothetical protein KQ248_20510 [Stutzerimonas zhaodongensis]RBA51603.1 hypothetical protein DQ403_22155 [Stutzerimonas zhaodongensis]